MNKNTVEELRAKAKELRTTAQKFEDAADGLESLFQAGGIVSHIPSPPIPRQLPRTAPTLREEQGGIIAENYSGLKQRVAVLRIMQEMARPLTRTEIIELLVKRGCSFAANKNAVSTILSRGKRDGIFIKTDLGLWSPAEKSTALSA